MKNPFHNTKASYYNDPEILEFWVNPDLTEKSFFHTIMEPTESMPIMILGGKGSGKTHILRFFSFRSQILRVKENKTILDQIVDDGYIGIYIVSNGLQASRFSGSMLSQDEWNTLFFYYINLEFLERTCKKIFTILNDSGQKTIFDMSILNDNMLNHNLELTKLNIEDLYKFFKEKRKEIDFQLASLRLPGKKTKLEINPILYKIDSGFYEIIDALLTIIKPLKDVKVLFILDEYENFSEEQQKYFNTLLRQPSIAPKKIGFRISGRLWAAKTWNTYDDQEILQVDSEIKIVYLENIVKQKFKIFADKLYKKRLEHILGKDSSYINFNKSFEVSTNCNENVLQDIQKKHKEKKHFKKLKKLLNDDHLFADIIEKFNCNNNYFLEKMNTLLLYKQWNQNYLSKEALLIQNACLKSQKRYISQLDKYKTYVLYQLFKDYGRSISYSGYKNIIDLSANNPRIFLTILSNIYKECIYQNIDLFSQDILPCKIQDKAILEASKWFWNNFTEDIKDERVEWAVIKICELFRAIYRSDNPTEKDLVIFTFDESELSKNVKDLIRRAIDHSLLIDLGFRKDRNSHKKLTMLRLHPMLSPRWDLSVSGGGTISFKKNDMESLFLKNEKEWEGIEKSILERYMIKKRNIISPKRKRKLVSGSLFDNMDSKKYTQKKISEKFKMMIPAGQANPSPPVGPALGERGVNIMKFCKAFNEKTKDKMGFKIPVIITVYTDRSFTFEIKQTPVNDIILKAAERNKGTKVGSITKAKFSEISEEKIKDNEYDMNSTSFIGDKKAMDTNDKQV